MEAVLRDLKSGAYFDAMNLAFLRIRALGVFRAWDEIFALPEFADLFIIRRPRVITQTLLECVYESKLRQFEEIGDAQAALKIFRSDIEPAYPSLWETNLGFKAPSAIKLLMLNAVGGQKPDPAARNRLNASVAGFSPADRQWLNAIAAVLPDSPTKAFGLDAAREAWVEGDCDATWEIVSELPPSAAVERLLVQSARIIDSLVVRRRTIELLASYPSEVVAELRLQRSIARALDETLTFAEGQRVSETASPAVSAPTSWTEWFDAFVSGASPAHLVRIARTGESEWNADEIVNNPSTVTQILRAFQMTIATRAPSTRAPGARAPASAMELRFRKPSPSPTSPTPPSASALLDRRSPISLPKTPISAWPRCPLMAQLLPRNWMRMRPRSYGSKPSLIP